MKPLLVVLAALALTAVRPAGPTVILVGDSTVQPASGYGQKLCARFRPEVACLNTAKGGRSTKSFRYEGRWEGVMMSAREAVRAGRPTYVLIQFGHNDAGNVPERHTEMDEFIANTRRYVREARAVRATPVLVTPLTRRQFKDGKLLTGDIEPRAAAVRQVAQEEKVLLLDLYADSQAAVQAMGPAEANTLAQAAAPPEVVAASLAGNSIEPGPQSIAPAFDYTHVGDKGAEVFSAILAGEIRRTIPALGRQLR